MNKYIIIKVPSKNKFTPADSDKIFEGIEKNLKYAVVYENIWQERVKRDMFGFEIPTNHINEYSDQCIDYYETKQEAFDRLNILPKVINKNYKNAFMVKRKK